MQIRARMLKAALHLSSGISNFILASASHLKPKLQRSAKELRHDRSQETIEMVTLTD